MRSVYIQTRAHLRKQTYTFMLAHQFMIENVEKKNNNMTAAGSFRMQ